MKKVIISISMLSVLLFLLITLISYNKAYGNIMTYGYPIEYQFQLLNRSVDSSCSLSDAPKELKTVVYNNIKKKYGENVDEFMTDRFFGPRIYRFLINDKVYEIFAQILYAEDYYIYSASDRELIITIKKENISADFMVKDKSLLYRTNNDYKEINIESRDNKDITRDAFYEEYRKYVPEPCKLNGGSFFRKNFPEKYKNTVENPTSKESYHNWQESWFFYNSEYYVIYESILCKYNQNTDTYTRLSAMGYQPTACFLDSEYIYYIYGEEGYNFFDVMMNHNASYSLKKAAYARISIVTLENEKVKKDAFFKLYDSFE